MTGPLADAGTTLRAARNAVMISFALNGFAFATWVSRIPETRHSLDLSNGALGLLLLAAAMGSVLTLPTTGALIDRLGRRQWWSGAASTIGLLGLGGAAFGASVLASVPVTALGLFFYGVGIGSWDVAMNVEGAAVERRLGRTIMPRFHAGFSLGTVLGAGGRSRHRRARAAHDRAPAPDGGRGLDRGAADHAVVSCPPGAEQGPSTAPCRQRRVAGLAGAAHADDRRDGASRSRSPRAPPTTGSRWR